VFESIECLNRRDGGSADQLSVNGIPLRRQQLYWRVIALQRTQRLQWWLRRVRMWYDALFVADFLLFKQM